MLRHAKEACKGRYRAEIQALLGLSLSEISLITNCPADAETYKALTAELMDASRKSLSEQVLRAQVKKPGPEDQVFHD